ncbi:class I SAM-dependent methyltransferase [Iamia sp. SCSIO 61187]|uniref:class I SAM-dependent methyltransferase n=1 Tax=Iamia sp. SCSIO 61187 TaxID=2722752 RepID=UPI001C62AC36|nr:class I SAM-dependent methyltransferase [Iamia sp. SCSIO 61187]QYG93418.1 class I SAM-dependent methyltransferase [Iamia sp. SCSIO 61187]
MSERSERPDGTSERADGTSDPGDDAWAGDRVARWLRQAEGLEVQLAPVSEVLFATAALAPGERVLDVGCGTGPTTREAAARVGPDGSVIGLDVSAAMLEAAAAAPVPEGAAPVEWVTADAVTWAPPEAAVDAVISRFGVMFFSDPPTAFANLAAATRPGGRLAVAVWARRDESGLFAVPLHAALGVLRAHDVPVPAGLPEDGGPFSLGDGAASVALLEGAGWADAAAVSHRLDLPFGGGLPPRAAAEAAVDFGPTRVALEGLADDVVAAAVDAIAEALAGHVDGSGHVVLGGHVIVLTATKPDPSRG